MAHSEIMVKASFTMFVPIIVPSTLGDTEDSPIESAQGRDRDAQRQTHSDKVVTYV